MGELGRKREENFGSLSLSLIGLFNLGVCQAYVPHDKR